MMSSRAISTPPPHLRSARPPALGYRRFQARALYSRRRYDASLVRAYILDISPPRRFLPLVCHPA